LQEAFGHRREAMNHDRDAQVATIEAEGVMAEANARAATAEGAERQKILDVATRQANRLLNRRKNEETDAARERSRIRDVTALDTAAKGMFAGFAKVTGFGASRGAGAGEASGPLQVGSPKYSQSANGARVIQFPPLELPQTGVDRALGAM